ncbi:NAD(P)-binding domain-containing protein [Bacillus cereus]|nr:NAD(P)-binding domain-containing protein [Bacillus cereus]
MKVGLIGLGKMGLNLGKNLIAHKHEIAALRNEFGGHAVEKK